MASISSLKPPFASLDAIDKQVLGSSECSQKSGAIYHVPDQPRVALEEEQVRLFLDAELSTTVLDKMYEWLWTCTTKDSKRIDPLHQQTLKGRAIILSEDPALHLVWFKDKVFIKPIPPALLNYDFWTRYLARDEQHFDRTTALGFLRSYGLSIRHRSDLAVALDRGLLPKDVDWLQWERFIDPFRNLEDRDVAKRYHFGQFRLSRLNILIRFLCPRGRNDIGNNRHYYTMHYYTAAYLRQFVGPGLFVFASVSLILSAMQVILSLPSQPMTQSVSRSWIVNSSSISIAFWGFCVTVLVGLAFSWLLLIGGPIIYLFGQQVFGYQVKRRFEILNTGETGRSRWKH